MEVISTSRPAAEMATDSTSEGPVDSSNKSTYPTTGINDTRATSLLGIPPEVRARIYTHLFEGLVLSPAHEITVAASSEALVAGSALNILYVCRKIHAEAHFTLLRVATFRLNNRKHHVTCTQVNMLPQLNRIRNLSIDSSLMLEWSPTLIRLVMHSLSHFEVREIVVRLGHQDMLKVENLIALSSSGPTSPARPSRAPSMNVFQRVVAQMERDCSLILAHFNEVTVRNMLVLHFRVHCSHVGHVVPAPPTDVGHRHEPKELVYAFSRKQMLATKPGADSVSGWS